MKYSLPCSCGNNIPVEVSQAGQQVSCSCGQQLEVPGLRAIRQLKPVRESVPQRPAPTGSWSVWQRTSFALGLALAGIGFLLAAYFQAGRSRLNTEEVVWDTQLDTDLQQLERMNLQEAWGSWKKVRESGIGPYTPPTYIQARMISEHWKNVVLFNMGVGCSGLLLMGIAFLLPRARPNAALKRPPGKR